MKTLFTASLVLLLAVGIVNATNDEVYESTSLWIGSHYTEFSDNSKKIGEYNLGDNEWLPEFGLNYLSREGNSIFRLDGHYFDHKNVVGEANATIGDWIRFKARYRSLIRQQGQDLLTNMSAREFFESTGLPGGKILTHEIQDVGADYNTHRQEILNELEILLSNRNNVRMVAAHRSILTDGNEQAIASNHCFSCHLTSREKKVDKNQHQIEAGIDAEMGKVDVGYKFGFRHFESTAPDVTVYYDPAKHPVNGGAVAEFSSRQIYDDATLVFSRIPKTQKMSHKVRLNSDVGSGRIASTLSYSRAENKYTDLVTNTLVGSVNYSARLSDRSRLIARAIASRLTADDPFIDLPTYRDGAADLNETDFDFTRYSTLDRWDTRLSVEFITRMNNRITFNVLGGFNRIARDDYVAVDDGTTTNELIGQLKARYRKGLRYSTAIKYRFEAITDPFVSSRGLFEQAGSGLLEPTVPTSNWIFYYQREDLRYQNITTVPTQKHVFSWSSNYRPTNKFNVNLGLRGQYDKNGDLDSLDVKHFSLQPNVAMNIMPNMNWTFAAGYTYSYEKSRLPVTVALFDG